MTDKTLWDTFSIYIRLRDTNADGYGRCFTCPRVIHWKKGDCGHGVPRQHKGTKYNEKNNHLQCTVCNWSEGGRREVYKTEMNKRYGQNTWDLMEANIRRVFKWSQFEINELNKYYKEEIKKIMLTKNFKL